MSYGFWKCHISPVINLPVRKIYSFRNVTKKGQLVSLLNIFWHTVFFLKEFCDFRASVQIVLKREVDTCILSHENWMCMPPFFFFFTIQEFQLRFISVHWTYLQTGHTMVWQWKRPHRAILEILKMLAITCTIFFTNFASVIVNLRH